MLILLVCGTSVQSAHAMPSFARQTGQDCIACHVGGYGPQLTPYGIRFKLGGYSDSDGKAGHIPLSAMLRGSWTHTSKDLTDVPPHYGSNNNGTLDEASIFLAGKLADSLGAFVQTTYSGVDRVWSLDNTDIRYAHKLTLGGKDTTLGVSLNNNPGIQDPFNTLPAWGFPYASSDLAPTPAAAPLINGGLGGSVAGLTAYGFWNDSIYAEVGAYRTLSASTLNRIGIDDGAVLSSPAMYWRLGFFNDMRKQNWSVGLFGLNAALQPDRSGGPSDKFNDVGLDASYQFLGTREHVGTVNARYTHEQQTRNAAFAASGADNLKGSLNELQLNASYYYNQSWGVTAGHFATNGSRDATLYGTSTGSPNSAGYMLQADWTPFGKETSWYAPWANLRLGLQHTIYTRFDGTSSNAGDNDTTYLFAWLAI